MDDKDPILFFQVVIESASPPGFSSDTLLLSLVALHSITEAGVSSWVIRFKTANMARISTESVQPNMTRKTTVSLFPTHLRTKTEIPIVIMLP
jgi:hypothetical protein